MWTAADTNCAPSQNRAKAGAMPIILTLAEIEKRAKAVNLTLHAIAVLAGVDRGITRNTDAKQSTLARLTDALGEEEKRLARHLAALGAPPQGEEP